jgi:hypothetical protein
MACRLYEWKGRYGRCIGGAKVVFCEEFVARWLAHARRNKKVIWLGDVERCDWPDVEIHQRNDRLTVSRPSSNIIFLH